MEREQFGDQNSPILGFFLESWKVNAFNRSNFVTSQTLQLVLIGAQMFFTLVSFVNGSASPTLLFSILFMLLASTYSFFSPVRVLGIEAT